MVHRQANEENNEIIFSLNFSAGAGWNNNIQTEFYLFVYREGWTDLAFSPICWMEERQTYGSYFYESIEW